MVSLDRRLLLMAFVAGLPGTVAAIVLLWLSDHAVSTKAALTAAIILLWLGSTYTLRDRIMRPLRTISSMLAALREDDFSIRARGAAPDNGLGAVLLEVNLLADTMRAQRLDAQEATALLRAVMAEIDVAIFAFDSTQRLALVNRYAERLLGRPAESLVGLDPTELGLVAALRPDAGIQDITFPGGSGRWEVRRRKFWQGGQPHELLMLADVSQPLREQERQAWQRLIRVIGHELNNSLAPIKSIAGSLGTLLQRPTPPADWRDDMQRGLGIIGSRADALGRFTTAYSQLARLPPPRLAATPLAPLLHRVAALDRRVPVTLRKGPDLVIQADADQLEQLVINLLRNAVDAALETGGAVTVGWTCHENHVDVWVDDDGPGLQSTSNLFVPFFTTKAGGSGIGLVLSRQIAEAHGGTVTLANRYDARGTHAALTLPLPPQSLSATGGVPAAGSRELTGD
jgi:nitrogen fixation/metabolism regulation signal transduction histidine kinase